MYTYICTKYVRRDNNWQSTPVINFITHLLNQIVIQIELVDPRRYNVSIGPEVVVFFVLLVLTSSFPFSTITPSPQALCLKNVRSLPFILNITPVEEMSSEP